MKIVIITLFEEIFSALHYGVCGRYIKSGNITFKFLNPRNYSEDKNRRVDDRPYGGGAGMILSCQPLVDAITDAKKWLCELGITDAQVIYMSAQGTSVNHKIITENLVTQQALVIIAGRYEGIDERVKILQPGYEFSIGDFVVSGGEIPATMLIDAIIRQLPGALGNEESKVGESFADGLLEFPQYTRPKKYKSLEVPEVLINGNHQEIARWRKQKAYELTAKNRPDLLK